MDFLTDYMSRADTITEFFTATFTVSEGASEGTLIGDLTRRLMAQTPAVDIRVFTAWDDGEIVGGIFFTRLSYEGDTRTVFVLGPVAVATDRQGQGIGQRLIASGLEALQQDSVDIAVTYGDPNFYARVGFKPITQADVPAPFALQYPEGWLAQPLTDAAFTPFIGAARCVPVFNDPVFW